MANEYQQKELTTQANFAKLCGVSPEAIRKAGEVGKITITGTGRAKRIVITAQNTIDYLNDRNSQRKPVKNANVAPLQPENPIKTRKTEEGGVTSNKSNKKSYKTDKSPLIIDLNNIFDNENSKIDLNLLTPFDVKKIKDLQTGKRAAIEYQKARNELIDRKLVTTVLGKIYTVEVNQIKTIADKTPSKIAAIFENNDDEKMLKVSALLSDEIAKALRHIQTISEKFLLEINNGNHEGLNV